jgi:hypothetical protein
MRTLTRRGYIVLILGLSFLLLLLSIWACLKDDVSVTSSINTDVEVKDLPKDVVESVSQHWPRARIESAQRIYNTDSWGDYKLTLKLEGGDEGSPVISETGTVKAKG